MSDDGERFFNKIEVLIGLCVFVSRAPAARCDVD
jgi:hypothetical protein